ncbi:MAG: diguanylate cyclase [Rhizobiales bacterium]|nr:diguanylate cyclase [Hyphomicrobiales bacterium]
MQTSINPQQSLLQNWMIGALVGCAYFMAACLSLHLTQGVGGIATIWPASGVFISALLLTKPARIVPLACAVGAASYAANTLFGASVAVALGITFANVIEGLMISQLVIRTSGVPQMLDDKRWLATFFGATVVGSATSGVLATVLSGHLTLPFLFSWFMTVGLGTLIVTPLIVTIASGLRVPGNALSNKDIWQLLLVAAGAAFVTFLVLTYNDERFLFLPMMAVIGGTYYFGSRGAAMIISVIAIVATAQTDFTGSTIGKLGLNGETLFLQFYLISLLCAAWPLSALMAAKEKLIARYAEANTYLKLAESTANVGHWYVSNDYTSLTWSEEVYRIHGIAPSAIKFDGALNLKEPTSLKLYHPDDREAVRAVLLKAIDSHEGFNYTARIVRPDGSVRHVSSIGHPRYDANGAFEGLFGTFHDITEQTEMLEALQIARTEALHEASIAQRLAETDDLTGIANRRKIMTNLQRAGRSARRNKTPLTIAIFDIDHFKDVNDQHGHQVGDEVLKRVATIVGSQLDPAHSVGRLGGEEFLVILPGETSDSGYMIVEHLRELIASEVWDLGGLKTVTVSAGLASFCASSGVEDALRRADGALYKAKECGRNALRSAA